MLLISETNATITTIRRKNLTLRKTSLKDAYKIPNRLKETETQENANNKRPIKKKRSLKKFNRI